MTVYAPSLNRGAGQFAQDPLEAIQISLYCKCQDVYGLMYTVCTRVSLGGGIGESLLPPAPLNDTQEILCMQIKLFMPPPLPRHVTIPPPNDFLKETLVCTDVCVMCVCVCVCACVCVHVHMLLGMRGI